MIPSCPTKIQKNIINQLTLYQISSKHRTLILSPLVIRRLTVGSFSASTSPEWENPVMEPVMTTYISSHSSPCLHNLSFASIVMGWSKGSNPNEKMVNNMMLLFRNHIPGQKGDNARSTYLAKEWLRLSWRTSHCPWGQTLRIPRLQVERTCSW